MRSKSVRFQRPTSQNQRQAQKNLSAPGSSNAASGPAAQDALGNLTSGDLTTEESLNLDKFYKELIVRDRQEFARILKSKEMAIRNDTQSKLRKQIT